MNRVINEAGDNYSYSAQMARYKLAIIGNIHESPELLTEN